MVRDDRLEMLAKAAGYSLIPPQEIFTVSSEISPEIKEKSINETTGALLYNKVRKWLNSSSPEGKTPSIRRSLISWIENHVHI